MIDLSSLTNGLTGGESMVAGNSISTPPPFTAPGSVSESTENESVGTPANPGLNAMAMTMDDREINDGQLHD